MRPGAILALAVVLTAGVSCAAQGPQENLQENPQALQDDATPPEAAPWPRQVRAGATTLTMYQPQLDAWDGARLQARAAVGASAGEPPRTRYGVVTLEADTLVDKGTRSVTLVRARIVQSEFPSASAAEKGAWEAAIRAELEGRSRTIELDRLEADLEALGAGRAGAQQALRNTPPRFVFSTVPALLVSIDGAPVYRRLEGLPLERVINTRPLLLRDARGVHYLKIFDGWMSAPALDGRWSVLAAPGADLERAWRQVSDAHLADPLTGQAAPDDPAPRLAAGAPAIHVASVPTELVVTDGAPRYVPIAGARLLYVENTTGNVFKSTLDSRTYVLASGRWFRAADEGGPWEYVAPSALPPDFAAIPDDSAKENVKASVAGTAQAREAAIAAAIPQTATVQVAQTTLPAPVFDGPPQFGSIAGTSLRYIVNTATTIIEAGPGSYYAVQDGVWFSASAPAGPYRVATSVPSEIYAIPPESPLYFVTAVRIYGVDDGSVTVGYTPAYQGTLVDPGSGVVVYGTGYAYQPWMGSYWYGTPVTYGYGASVAYTPWTGWAVAFGLGWAWGAYPYWGAWAAPAWGAAYGARGGAVAWGARGWAGYTGNIYSQWGNRASVGRAAGGFDAWSGNAWASRVGSSYNSRTGVASAGQRSAVRNVYTGEFAAGARGVAQGPRGAVAAGGRGIAADPARGVAAAGRRGVIADPASGRAVQGASGVVVDRASGQAERVAGARGAGGGAVARVGNDVYAGRDGQVYRNTGAGWERHGAQGWSAAGDRQGAATMRERLDGDRGARQLGEMRTRNFDRSAMNLQRNFGGHRGGFRRR
ncbi:autotransporter [Massilia oculi]|uniref:autotransporter n=1 Tax=Massilia oculi TaxID=945844 RepID=UPI0028AA5A9F|nr:autotransporter [Massilia oculi]